jgi:hypothetical protein
VNDLEFQEREGKYMNSKYLVTANIVGGVVLFLWGFIALILGVLRNKLAPAARAVTLGKNARLTGVGTGRGNDSQIRAADFKSGGPRYLLGALDLRLLTVYLFL